MHAVGNYFISLAEDTADLERIDPAVFVVRNDFCSDLLSRISMMSECLEVYQQFLQVSDEIKSLFGKYYAEGYGFVVCSFDPNKTMQAHPIGNPIAFSIESHFSDLILC